MTGPPSKLPPSKVSSPPCSTASGNAIKSHCERTSAPPVRRSSTTTPSAHWTSLPAATTFRSETYCGADYTAYLAVGCAPFKRRFRQPSTVTRGEAFAFVGNLATTSDYIGAAGLTDIKVLGETPFVYRLGMAVQRDAPVLRAILQKDLDAIPRHDRDAI